ncbi:acylphosphatase [Danxiaibacter flavus]|uniref:acylphosphatase n=1 Tax=Danxiaibacter flavus TaxID=3049108 RepID=A0ABV3ZNL5_9BACT|nr:acylphosphatase [Chitinophagaceae bacterium DXS]
MYTVHLLIKGKVQGVFYRASAKDVADKLGLTGWIKNAGENVEAVVCGNKDDVLDFVNWCRKGPARARVEDVVVTERPEEQFDGFEITRG